MKTRILNSRPALLLFSVILIISGGCGNSYEQSTTLTEYSDIKNKDLSALYFYPTTIRMISKVLGDQSGAALSEIEKGTIFFSWEDDNAKTRDIVSQLKSRVEKEGFEMLMQIKSSGNNVDVFIMDRDIDDYVLLVDGEQGIFILEILGNLSASSVRSLGELDMSQITEILDFKQGKDEAKIDSSKTESN